MGKVRLSTEDVVIHKMANEAGQAIVGPAAQC
jgi:hypothetical protein